MLIDVGDKTDGKLIAKCLKQLGIENIDYLIGTHSDDDHIGGMMDIVNNFEIGSLYMPLKKANNQSYIELSKNANIKRIEINDIINIRSANAIIKWVDNMGEYSDNNSSIVLQLNYKDKKYLFTEDIETKVENELIKQNSLEEIDILKVAHHGSNSSTSEKFLDIIKPKFAIISSGSTYSKFPNIECLKRILKLVDEKNSLLQFNIERRMPLKLDLGLKLANNVLQSKEISNFIQELSNTLKDNNVLAYKDYDSTKVTRKNEEKTMG